MSSEFQPIMPDMIYRRLPAILQEVTKHFKGRERDVVLTSSLGVISSLMPKVFGYYDSSKVSPNLFFIIVAPAASGKGVMMKSRILAEGIHEKLKGTKIDLSLKFEDDETGKDEINKKKEDSSRDLKLKIVPANTSSAQLYHLMNQLPEGVLIIESEADTLANALGQEWGGFSDLLRKVFHHESVSSTRKTDNTLLEIRNPKLSLVLSGTPEQLKRLLSSNENGLSSRFVIYQFNEIADFKRVFDHKSNEVELVFQEQAKKIEKMYDYLSTLDQELEFKFSEVQNEKFYKYFIAKQSEVLSADSEGFLSNLKRFGLIFFRIAMILTVLRRGQEILKVNAIECSNLDFVLTLHLVQIYYQHTLLNFTLLDPSLSNALDEELFERTPDSFSTKEFNTISKKLGIPKRSSDKRLNEWQNLKLIKKIKHGHYKKLYTTILTFNEIT